MSGYTRGQAFLGVYRLFRKHMGRYCEALAAKLPQYAELNCFPPNRIIPAMSFFFFFLFWAQFKKELRFLSSSFRIHDGLVKLSAQDEKMVCLIINTAEVSISYSVHHRLASVHYVFSCESV
jgi:hypothetical protein